MVEAGTGSPLVFCLERSSGSDDVFPKISLVDKIFEILAEGPALGSLASLVVMKGAIAFHSKMSKIV